MAKVSQDCESKPLTSFQKHTAASEEKGPSAVRPVLKSNPEEVSKDTARTEASSSREATPVMSTTAAQEDPGPGAHFCLHSIRASPPQHADTLLMGQHFKTN